ncbi:coronin-2A isoform X1 [Misgurnus anguillicaudatus]|uniref:coronin-2A isoform X1 n=1 Tax=Misgurnus anguillicaudatus TaxID=75329 RepID=UPI003CCF964E
MSQRYTCTWIRHITGKAAGKGRCYHGLSITRSVQDNLFCAVNPRFIALVTECTGGGAFIVISVHQTGRVSPLHARVCGHSARVMDVKWDPFNDRRIASCSEDCTVKVWDIPQNGLKDDVTQPSKDLLAHSRRVAIIEWHPTARDLLLSSAYDCKVLVWRLDTAAVVIQMPVCVINTHTQLVLSLTFNHDGSLLATTCKDQKIRIIEPRTGRVLQESSSTSHKAHKILFLWNLNMLLTTGNSSWNQRQFALWDLEDLSEPVLEEDFDGGSGVVFPFYDPDTQLLFLAGKGDGNIRYYEVSAIKPYMHFLAEYRSQFPQRGLGVMPKRGLNINICEVFRFYRLVGVRDLVEPLSFCVPRKQSGVFHEDIYPLTAASEPALTAHEWLMGQNKGPLLVSLRPKSKEVQTHIIQPPDAGQQNPKCEVIVDERDWTEDDTQSHDWISARTLSDVDWTEATFHLPPEPETEVSQRQEEQIQHLQEKLEQKECRIKQLELKITRHQTRASF